MNEMKLAALVSSQIAEALKPQLLPILGEIEQDIVSQLKGRQREGKLSLEHAIAGIAQLCVIEDLKNSLETKIKRASKIREGMNNDNTNE